MSGTQSRHHHYVPQCYLRNFAVDEQVYVFNSKTEKLFRTSIRNIAGERDLYKLEGGNDSQLAEKAFSEIEAHVTPILSKIITEQKLPSKESDDFISLLYFIAVLFVRHPDYLENIEDFISRTMEIATDVALHHIPKEGKMLLDGQFITKEQAIDAIKAKEEGRIKLHVPRDQGVATSLSSIEKLTELLVMRDWCLLVADVNLFVTSSKPVMLLWDDLSLNLKHPPGFGLMNTTVHFIISPKLALIGKCVPVKESCVIDSKGVAGVNGLFGFYNPQLLISQSNESFIQLGAELVQFKNLESVFSKINSKNSK